MFASPVHLPHGVPRVRSLPHLHHWHGEGTAPGTSWPGIATRGVVILAAAGWATRRPCIWQRRCSSRTRRQGVRAAWQWWGAKSSEAWPERLEDLMSKARGFLKDFFGHDEYREEQEEALRVALNHQDLEIYWPTAAGKSLVYQLVALLSWQEKRGIVIVVEPTIALMQDQVQQFEERANAFGNIGAKACLLGSAQTDKEVIDGAVAGDYCLVYMCPESVTQRYLQAFRSLYDSQRMSLFVIDEACYIPLWGNYFRPAFQNLDFLRVAYPSVPILALSGTAPPKRQWRIRESLKLENPVRSRRPMFRPNLHLATQCCIMAEEKFAVILDLLDKGNYPALVYVPTKKLGRTVRQYLERASKLSIGYIDGDTPADLRAIHNLDFQRDLTDVMVATDAYGQGIDKANIRLVVHFEAPVNFELYINHIGRAGRDGKPSQCVLLYSLAWFKTVKQPNSCFTKELENMDVASRKEEHHSRKILKSFCTSGFGCRWQRLLVYSGCEDEMDKDGGCGDQCDVCRRKAKKKFQNARNLKAAATPEFDTARCVEPLDKLLLREERSGLDVLSSALASPRDFNARPPVVRATKTAVRATKTADETVSSPALAKIEEDEKEVKSLNIRGPRNLLPVDYRETGAWQWWGAKSPEEWPEVLEGLMASARGLMKDFFGHEEYREGQEEALRAVLCHQDLEMYWPTAAGKSLIYQLVALLSWQANQGIVIVVEPTIAVQQDQIQQFNTKADACGAVGAKACLLGSAQTDKDVVDAALAGNYCLVYMCPEGSTQRFLQDFMPLYDSGRLSLFVIDEACYIPLWGYGFRPAFQDLSWLRDVYPGVPMIALSGTAPPALQLRIRHFLKLEKPLRSHRPMFRGNLHLATQSCQTDKSKLEVIVDLLAKGSYPALVYVPTKPMGRRTLRRLQACCAERGLELSFAYIDGNTPPSDRADMNLAFQNDEIDVMVATDAYGQGIDKANIRLVIHWEPPVNFEVYLNHIGRAGRDGVPSKCVLLHSHGWWRQLFEDDRFLTEQFKSMDDKAQEEELTSRTRLRSFAVFRRCRWRALLRHNGCEKELDKNTGCGQCDVCCQENVDEVLEDFTAPGRLLLLSLERIVREKHSGLKEDVLDLALETIADDEQDLNLIQIRDSRNLLRARLLRKSFMAELLEVLWTSGFVNKTSTPMPEFILEQKGKDAIWKAEPIYLVPSERLRKLKAGENLEDPVGKKQVKKIIEAVKEWKATDICDDEARANAVDYLKGVLSDFPGNKDVPYPLSDLSEKKMISKPSSVRGPRVLKQTKRTPLRLLQSLAKDGRIDMKLTQAQGTWRCTLAFRRGRAAHIMTPLTATGKSKNASLKQAWHQVCENGFRVKADTTPWLQEQLAALSSRSSDLRLCVVGSCHGESMHQAPLFAAKLKCANQYIMGKCGSWYNAVRSTFGCARAHLLDSKRLPVVPEATLRF
ncbi:unnamed protein product [Durusdinium trenchii]|uniref:DNA 3'-5' helicase n=1 Tax=Durusdinium trenchii TaxID=1381693 RepID=A0ABP0PD96_9DINO